MMYAILFPLSILVIPAIACEGQCIVDITHAFVGNYTTPVQNVFTEAATKISKLILHSQQSSVAMMEPLRNSYDRNAYDAMEKAIFPSYFHGKCQVNGVDPVGCPNPDCPVVCGTPGSLVHFYSVLQHIAFNATASNLMGLCAPSSKGYQAFETAVLHELGTKSRFSRSLHSARAGSTAWPHRDTWAALDKRIDNRAVASREDVKAHLKLVCQNMVQDLTSQCGGRASLPNCSWEEEMKPFILSFP